MARIKIDLPDYFTFTTTIPIRVTDVNYGGHVGNDTILSLIQEARMQYLKQLGYSELEFAGVGLIMADAGIEFKNELFYDDVLTISIACTDFRKVSFDMYYKLEKVFRADTGNKKILVAAARTEMVCFDYSNKKIIAIPEEARRKMQ